MQDYGYFVLHPVHSSSVEYSEAPAGVCWILRFETVERILQGLEINAIEVCKTEFVTVQQIALSKTAQLATYAYQLSADISN